MIAETIRYVCSPSPRNDARMHIPSPSSRQDIATINDRVTASLVGRSIAGKIEVQSLDLLHVALASKRSHSICFVNNTGSCTHLCIKEAGGHNIDSCEFSPLSSKALSEVVDCGLRGVVDLYALVKVTLSGAGHFVLVDRLVH